MECVSVYEQRWWELNFLSLKGKREMTMSNAGYNVLVRSRKTNRGVPWGEVVIFPRYTRKIEEGGCVVKFPTPAWSSTNLLNIAKFVESGLVFAHVRAASDGAVLVGSVNHENTHPFQVDWVRPRLDFIFLSCWSFDMFRERSRGPPGRLSLSLGMSSYFYIRCACVLLTKITFEVH